LDRTSPFRIIIVFTNQPFSYSNVHLDFVAIWSLSWKIGRNYSMGLLKCWKAFKNIWLNLGFKQLIFICNGNFLWVEMRGTVFSFFLLAPSYTAMFSSWIYTGSMRLIGLNNSSNCRGSHPILFSEILFPWWFFEWQGRVNMRYWVVEIVWLATSYWSCYVLSSLFWQSSIHCAPSYTSFK
jgi:hypothetical protein